VGCTGGEARDVTSNQNQRRNHRFDGSRGRDHRFGRPAFGQWQDHCDWKNVGSWAVIQIDGRGVVANGLRQPRDIASERGRIVAGGRPPSFISFTCPNCKAFYHIVKVEAGPETIFSEVTCRVCGTPFPNREDSFVLKYFLLRNGGRGRRAKRQAYRLTGKASCRATFSAFVRSVCNDGSDTWDHCQRWNGNSQC
jgi:predicted Zn finger-like uncharacterized protein